MGSQKQLQTVVLDAGPILKNDPSLSSLLAKCEELVTTPSVISEIKDLNARTRFETTIQPFLVLRIPTQASVRVVMDFAKKTGDLAVLSKPDIQLLALAYEIECDKNGGDWRLRKVPGQKGLNGSPPTTKEKLIGESQPTDKNSNVQQILTTNNAMSACPAVEPQQGLANDNSGPSIVPMIDAHDPVTNGAQLNVMDPDDPAQVTSIMKCRQAASATETLSEIISIDSSDSEGWITPSNIKKSKTNMMDSSFSSMPGTIMQVAVLTTDYAMQNVLLQMNLNLLSPSMQRVRNIKTYILRCHACFEKCKDMNKQFCPRCGKPTLIRASCSTDHNGKFTLHLKKNMQWNHRGDRFSIPKPVPGAANGKAGVGKGGGKGGWGQELILAEDQKEYVRALNGRARRKDLNLMDNDNLPSILTGDRGTLCGRPKIGGGRNINSKRR